MVKVNAQNNVEKFYEEYEKHTWDVLYSSRNEYKYSLAEIAKNTWTSPYIAKRVRNHVKHIRLFMLLEHLKGLGCGVYIVDSCHDRRYRKLKPFDLTRYLNHRPFRNDFFLFIEAVRHDKEITIAKLLNFSGISSASYYHYRKSTSVPTLFNISKILAVLNLRLTVLRYESPKPFINNGEKYTVPFEINLEDDDWWENISE